MWLVLDPLRLRSLIYCGDGLITSQVDTSQIENIRRDDIEMDLRALRGREAVNGLEI